MKKLVVSLLILVLIFVFSCCSSQTEINFGIEYYPSLLELENDFRPHTVNISNQMYETLINLGDDYYTIEPNLVQNWKISEDGLKYTFQLRNDVYFHDQQKLSAWDVKSSFEYYRQRREYWTLADKIESVSVLDSVSFEFKLVDPNSQFLFMLCSPLVFMVMKPDTSDGSHSIPIGTGPYFLANTISQKRVVLEQYTQYWNKSSDIERISFIVFESDKQSRRALINDEVDIVYLISGSEIDRLRWKGKINYFVQKSGSITFFGFNMANKPFNDIRVRRAVLKALNLPKIVHNLNRGNALVAMGPLPPVYNFGTDINQDGYDPEAAKLLLREAGYDQDLTIQCNFPQDIMSRLTLVEAVKSELAKSGIILKPEILESWQQHTDSVFSKNAQLFFDGLGSLFIGEPHYFLETLYYSQSRHNYFRYNNSLVDSLLDMAKVELNQSMRESAYETIVREIIEDIPAVFHSHVIPHFAYNSEKIKTMSASPYQVIRFNQIELND